MRLKDISGIKNTQRNVFKLTEDINISNREFSTISKFEGILNGNGYTISNLDSSFINILDGEIHNIQFVDCDITL